MTYDTEAEKNVLGCALHSEEALINVMTDMSDLDFSDDYLPFFTTMKALFMADRPVRMGELIRILKEQHRFDVTANERLLELNRVTEIDLPFWTKRVNDARKRRELEPFLRDLLKAHKDSSVDVDKIIMAASEGLCQIAISKADMKFLNAKEMVKRQKERLKERVKNPKRITGVPFGYPTIDNEYGGALGGDLILISAATGVGKTALAQNIACYASKTAETLYVSSEMDEEEMMDRWNSLESGYNHTAIRTGWFPNNEIPKVVNDGLDRFSELKLFFHECVDMSIENITAIARKFKLVNSLKVMVIDYVGRMEMFGAINKNVQEYQVLEHIARSCKKLAQSLDIAIILLVQLTDDGHLQGSKRIKNEATLSLQLLPLGPQELIDNPGVTHWLNIDKGRRCRRGPIPVIFDAPRMRILQVDPER